MNTTESSSWLERLTVVGLLIWMLAYTAVLAISIVHSYNRLPVMDYWETIAHLDGYHRFPPFVLWEQHYEHRVITAEIVFAFDWLFLQGREMLPMFLNSVFDFGVWLVFVLVLRRSLPGNRNAARCALLLAGIVMFWPGVAVVVAFPFLLQWLIYQFSATASFAALAYGRVPLAVFLALVATFSSANGLFIWPILVVLAFLSGLPRRTILPIAIVGVLVSCTFFVGYHNLGNSHPSHIWLHPAKFFGYLFTFLGMPLGTAGTWTALAAGCGSVFLGIALFYFIRKWKLVGRSPVILLIGLILITWATAFVTSLSRIPIERRFEDAIITPGRYVNTGAHYWATLILLTFVVANSKSRKWGWTVIACSAMLLAVTLSQSGPWIHNWMNQYANYQAATIAIESGVDFADAGTTLNYADGTLATRNLPELERRRLALYASPEYQLLGKHFQQLAGAIEVPTQAITSVQPVPGGFRIVGWSQPRAKTLLVIDGSNTVIGFGTHPGAGLPIGILPPAGHENEAFLAYAGPTFRQSEARLFLVR